MQIYIYVPDKMSQFIQQPAKILFYAGIGFLIRVALITFFKDIFRQRVEVTTPITNWKRAYEAVYLWNSGLDPYSGDIFHEYPISLQFYKIIVSCFNVDLVFAATDIITAILLQLSSYNQLIISDKEPKLAQSQSMKVLLIYLFSPLTLISCAGMSTSIFTNFLIAVINFILPIQPFRALTCVLCAFLACNNIHYGTLILPIFLSLEYCSNKKQIGQKKTTSSPESSITEPYYRTQDFSSSLTSSIMMFLTTLITLTFASFFLMGNKWTFVKATYLFVLKVQDLTPNIGMFWYFFTEVFELFVSFFTWIVQINAFIHVIPLSIFLRDDPFFAIFMLILTSTIFQPYPSISNIGLITSLLPQWSELFSQMNKTFITSCAAVACMSLWPIFWHLWIVMGTANANFYFGATLAFNVTLISFMGNVLNAHRCVKTKVLFEEYKKNKDIKVD